ncbi:hypothetical protein P7K49_036882, partial [Saguinus oedipus]
MARSGGGEQEGRREEAEGGPEWAGETGWSRRASLRGAEPGEGPGRLGTPQPLTQPPAPRPRLHAPPAVAASQPPPRPPPGRRRLPPPAALPRPRSPGSPRSPALDNALVKTAELFLTSPPPLLIKAPP